MTHGVRAVLSALAVAFTAYLAAGALLWTDAPRQPVIQVVAVACYLVTTWLCVFWKARSVQASPDPVMAQLSGRAVLPPWAAVLALAVAALVPSASWLAAGPGAALADFATWSLGGVGALMAIVMVRRRPWSAWLGVVFVAVAAIAWIGAPAALARGLVGVPLWVGVAQLIMGLVDRAAHDTAELTTLQRSASEWLASQEGRRWERRRQVQRALALAGPVLARTVARAGRLGPGEREHARIAEGTLRDELRGAALLDDGVRAAIATARRRGASVSVLDDGGLDELTTDERARLHAELAAVLAGAASERLYIRTSTHDDIAVTVVGRSAGGDGEDTVDLWHELARHPESASNDAADGPAA